MSPQWVAFNVDRDALDGCFRALKRHDLKFSVTAPVRDEGYTIHITGQDAEQLIRVISQALKPSPEIALPWTES